MNESNHRLESSFKVALVQLCTGNNIEKNITETQKRILAAVDRGAKFVITPEQTTLMELSDEAILAKTPTQSENPAISHFADLAKSACIYLLIGSISVRAENSHKLCNRSFLFSPDGNLQASYDKIHLFDTDLAHGESYRESKFFIPGKKSVITDLPWGKLGMTICYDLRFPHLFRRLAKKGANFISIPSAFTQTTGKAHWHVLLRARAIENACYIFAAAQCGQHENGRQTYGHSLIVSPWGEIIAEANDNDEFIIAEIDIHYPSQVKKQIPSLVNEAAFD